MKTACGANARVAFVFACLLLAIVQPCQAAPAGVQTIFFEDFDQRDHLSRDPQAGKLTVSGGVATLHDLRKGQELSNFTPPMWTTGCKGTAPANSYLEVRVKASQNVMYWVDLVNERNQSIATIELQEGTGDWQIRRARFEGLFGSAGDDLFIRVKKKDDKGEDSVQIDYIAVVKGNATAATQAAAPTNSAENLALAKHECLLLSSSFQDVTDHYTDRLIDGKTNTNWRSFPSVKGPHWVELRWEYPIQIDRIVLRPAPGDAPDKIELQTPAKDGWKKIKTITPPPIWPDSGISAAMDLITTNRLRVCMGGADATVVALSEIEVYGPPQPLVWKLRPYWKAKYIWYPEPDKQIKAETRYFRTTFDIPDLSKVINAQLQVRSNDGYVAFINGSEVASGSVVIRPVDVKASLRQGKNCIAFEAHSAKDPGWPLMTLLAQLNVNADKDQVIGTDATWRCSPTVSEGWKLADFDDHAWANAFICATPPDEPWGRIPYFDVSETRPIRIVKPVSLQARAGEAATFDLELQATPTPDQDLLFILKAGETEINSDRSNYIVSQATLSVPKAAWSKDGKASVKVALEIPDFAPAINVPLRLSILGVERAQNFRITSGVASATDNAVGMMSIERPNVPVQRIEPGAMLDPVNGVCRIRVGSQSYSPFLWALQTPSLDRFGAYSATGIHLYHLQIYPYRIDEGVDYDKTHFAFIDQHIRHLLAIDPSARVLVEMDVRDSSAWAAAHPEERLVTAQGTKKAASMASAAYAKDVSDYVRRLVRFINAKPYAASVIGYIPEIAEPESAMCGADENAFQTDRLKLNIGDYNPQALAMFRQFLREKYGNSAAKLKAAWKDDAVDFDTAAPKLEELTREGEKGGVFRDPTRGRMPFDYFEFLSTLVPNFVEQNIAKIIKEETGGKTLVGFYYGYVVETLRSVNNPGALLQGNHFHFDKVIDSPVIDFFMSPLQYEHRMSGDRMFSFQPMDSIRLHRKLYIAEEDLRTHVSGLTSYGRQRSEQESVAVLKNHLGTAFIKGTGAWMADWSSGAGHSRTAVPFFKDPALLNTISSIKKLYDSETASRSSNTQIAVFVSPKTMYYHDVAYASVLYKNLISEMLYTQMPYIGAPFDTYAIEDVDKKQVQDQYRLYIFLNAFFMDDAQRAAIEKLKHDGKTLLFFYAPGYVSNERGLQANDIASVSGFKVDISFDKQIQKCAALASKHPLLTGIPAGTEYTASGFDYAPDTARVHPTAFGPRFIISDPAATALATFDDKSVALAARDFGSWKSVYASVPYLDTQALRNIAAWAGVHLYTDERIVVEASDQFVLLHSGFDIDRKMKLHLPEALDVEDALTGESVAKHARQADVFLPRATTMIYRLKK